MIETLLVDDREIVYNGSQLRSHWAYEEYDVIGDSLVSFMGPADVKVSGLVDIFDRKANAPIKSQSMLHFIGEFFGVDLKTAVLYQHLLVFIIKECIEDDSTDKSLHLMRSGDDLYDTAQLDRKLSVSIATVSPVSSLVHVGLNIISKDTPIDTLGLADIGIDPKSLAEHVLYSFCKELDIMKTARAKVRPVI